MKKEKWDGRSRPTNDLYKKEFNRIFGKKEQTLHEMAMEGYEEEKKNEINIDYEYLESLKDKI